MNTNDIKDLIDQIPDQDGYETDAFLMDLESALISLQTKVEKLQDDSNILQCLNEAGIDNVEAHSIGIQLYYERYPEKDEWGVGDSRSVEP